MLALSPINPSPQDHSPAADMCTSFDSGGQNVASNLFFVAGHRYTGIQPRFSSATGTSGQCHFAGRRGRTTDRTIAFFETWLFNTLSFFVSANCSEVAVITNFMRKRVRREGKRKVSGKGIAGRLNTVVSTTEVSGRE